jgi:GNAT superfamily N-acetyltransferase
LVFEGALCTRRVLGARIRGVTSQTRSAAGGRVREAHTADLSRIAAIAAATGQGGEWAGTDPDYVRHLMQHGRMVVAEANGQVAGFGASQQVGAGQTAVTMLCDLFVDPAMHGFGLGRALLTNLWRDAPRRMTFSSRHAYAIPLYTSFGLDAWWPLLYLRGNTRALNEPAGWATAATSPDRVAALEREWTSLDRTADHRAWSVRPHGRSVLVSRGGAILAAGTVAGADDEFGIAHLALNPGADDAAAAAAVVAVLAALADTCPTARACLPGPHPAVRPLLAAGWRIDDFDIYMASEPGLLDPRRAVPSAAQA